MAEADHDAAAGSHLWWCDSDDGAWLTRADASASTAWAGVAYATNGAAPAAPAPAARPASWRPWTAVHDGSEAPYHSWFVGARTNACFNAVDCHLLAGRGGDVAYTSCDEAGGHRDVTRRGLAVAVAEAARCLTAQHGLKPLDRVFFHMPTGIEHMVYCLAAMRIGAVYSCTAVDTTEAGLRHRLADFAPDVAVVPSTPTPHGGGTTDCAAHLAAAGCEAPLVRVAAVDVGALEASAAKQGQGDDKVLSAALFKTAPCVSLREGHPLFVSYTSGSTGKPKGIVHTHGGYVYGVKRSFELVFEATPGKDCILTLGTTGWITGQSYMLVGPLVAGVRAILLEGSPVYPTTTRFVHAAKAHGATIFKTGSALIRQIMADPAAAADLRAAGLPAQLRYATFCAEPVNEAVQAFACDAICASFMNSYWATEHGAIVFTRSLEPGVPVRPDTKCWPLPFVKARVEEEGEAAEGDGDILVTEAYPYLVRTVWGDVDNAKAQDGSWRGDLDKLASTYWRGGCFVQGDTARAYGDGGYTFHGRSDEVMNISGNRVGTEELEAAVWAASETAALPGGGLRDCVVVGAPDHVKGTTPIAFVVLDVGADDAKAAASAGALLAAARKAGRERLGAHAEPEAVIAVRELPKTMTGKNARKTLQVVLAGRDPSVTRRSLKNPQALDAILPYVEAWRRQEASLALPAVELAEPWKRFRFDEHVIQGTPLLPGVGWMLVLAEAWGVSALENVRFKAGLRAADRRVVSMLKNRAHVKVLGETAVAGAADDAETAETVLVEADLAAAAAAEDVADDGVASPPKPPPRRSGWGADSLETRDGDAHYTRCHALGLEYVGSYRVVDKVEWNHGFCFNMTIGSGEHLSAVLDAGLQAICAYDSATTYIPVMVQRFSVRRDSPALSGKAKCVRKCRVVGEVVDLRGGSVKANIDFYLEDDVDGRGDGGAPFASLRGAVVTKVASRAPRLQPAAAPAAAGGGAAAFGGGSAALAALPDAERAAAVLSMVLGYGATIAAADMDPSLSLFENGLHSLRAIELAAKLQEHLGVRVGTKILADAKSLSGLAQSLSEAVAAGGGGKVDSLSNVNQEALARIAHARTGPREGPWEIPQLHRLPGIFMFMFRRGLIKYLLVQYRDGLWKFLLNPPKTIDLSRTVVVKGPRVAFSQTDFNEHFTVREIVRDSERGMYNLVHETGLAHIEHYYGKMLFASDLTAKFAKEIPEGEPYEQRLSITDVTGPLVTMRCCFHMMPSGVYCFEVSWRMMIVIDVDRKLMYDFETGGTHDDEFVEAMLAKDKVYAQTAAKRIICVFLAVLGVVVAAMFNVDAISLALLPARVFCRELYARLLA